MMDKQPLWETNIKVRRLSEERYTKKAGRMNTDIGRLLMREHIRFVEIPLDDDTCDGDDKYKSE
jgi:hypothetical protein